MPFPLAHPAAVFPLRRWYSERRLNFSALVIGTLIPDTGYCLGAAWTHSLFPGIAFSVSAGWLVFQLVRKATRPRTQAGCILRHEEPARTRVVLLSLAIGAATHIFLDSMTHRTGWLATHWKALGHPVLRVAGQQEQLCDLLYYGLTFAGSAWVTLRMLIWLDRQSINTPTTARLLKSAIAISFAAAVTIFSVAMRAGGKN